MRPHPVVWPIGFETEGIEGLRSGDGRVGLLSLLANVPVHCTGEVNFNFTCVLYTCTLVDKESKAMTHQPSSF